ncbi:hypothetical protein SH501x_002912 [Pirellulaceae bacterium SH501]
MDQQIDHYLQYVVNRFRRIRFAWLLCCLWLGLVLFMLFAWNPSQSPAQSSSPLSVSLSSRNVWLFAIAFAIALWILNRWSYSNRIWTAEQIELSHPELKQRLITSVSPALPNESPFLRKQLANETIDHARAHDWGQAVPTSRMLSAWALQTLCLALACYVSWITAPASVQGVAKRSVTSGETTLREVVVEPGDVEIERGTDIVVTARFPGEGAPDQVYLVPGVVEEPNQVAEETSRAGAKEFVRTRLERSLKDPIYGGYLRKVTSDLTYRIETDGYQSPTYRVKVFDFPSLVRSDATIAPPDYAKQYPRTIEDTRRVTVAEGTDLKWTCFVNKPLQNAELIDETGVTVPLLPSSSDPLKLEASFKIDASKQWSVRLLDSENRSAKFDEKLTAKVIRNEAPEIKLAKAQDLRVSPLQEVPLKATVRDDFEVKRTGITVMLGSNEPSESEIAPAPSKAGKLEVAHMVDLESLQAEPDQLLSYFFWAEDIDTAGNVRRVEGDMFFAEVRPFEEIFREGEAPSAQQQQQQQQQGQSQAAQQAEELAELQKQIISGTWNILRREGPQKRTASFSEDVTVLADSQSKALEQTAELEESVQDDKSAAYLKELKESMESAIQKLQSAVEQQSLTELREALMRERKAYEGLLKLRAREHNIVQQQQQQSRSSSRSSAQQNRQQQLEQLELNNQENPYQEEQQAQDSEPSTPEREARQVMNRLEELARRQKDLNEQLKNLENALQEAKTEEEKQQLEDQLQRLREDQEEMVRDADELLERMNEEENRQAMEQAREQVEQAREQLQQSSQALSQGETSSALSSGTRAQRQMDETREQLREESSSQMESTMRNMVQQARELEQKQQALERKLNPSEQSDAPSSANETAEDASPLRPEGTSGETNADVQAWRDQQKKWDELMQSMRDTVSEAESSEPLLAEELYDSYREAAQQGVEKRLNQIPMLLDRGLEEPAEKLASEAGKAIQQLREGIESAAQDILGNEQESLKRALRELDRAQEDIEQEIQQKSPSNQPPPPDPPQPGQSGQQPQQPGQPQPNPSTESPNNGSPAEAPNPSQSSDARRASVESFLPQQSGAGTANEGRFVAPLTGENFREWTDALRDVEELVDDPNVKGDVARIREAAREMRVEYKRHSKEPQWDLVKKLIADPLARVREQVNEELLRKAAEKNALVPIDRDPVPANFQRQLDRYYENLGSGASR